MEAREGLSFFLSEQTGDESLTVANEEKPSLEVVLLVETAAISIIAHVRRFSVSSESKINAWACSVRIRHSVVEIQ
jgi:hypothetical protein